MDGIFHQIQIINSSEELGLKATINTTVMGRVEMDI